LDLRKTVGRAAVDWKKLLGVRLGLDRAGESGGSLLPGVVVSWPPGSPPWNLFRAAPPWEAEAFSNDPVKITTGTPFLAARGDRHG
jgi:hypothetical protein